MVDLTELDGVGPARSESLEQAGYEDFESIANADQEDLSEGASINEDTALDFIVQSQNIVAEQGAEVEESEPITEEVAEAVEEVEQDVEEEEQDDENVVEQEMEEVEEDHEDVVEESEGSDPPYQFEISFDAPLQYDTFFDSVMAQRSKMLQANRTGVEAFDHALEQMREGGTEEPVSLTMTEGQLNDLHNCVRQKTVEYKGDNLIEHMDELTEVLNQINDARSEHLF